MKEDIKYIIYGIAYIMEGVLIGVLIMSVIIGIPAYALIQIIEAIKN